MPFKQDTNIRSLEADAFRDGTQGLPTEPALKEIQARFAQREEAEKRASTERVKRLEGLIVTLQRRKADAEQRWAELEFRTDGTPPPIFLSLCAVVLSWLAVVGETAFLAPIMDGLGIADPVLQVLLSAVIVIICAGLFETTKKLYQRAAQPPAEGQPKQRPVAVSILFGLLTLLS
jgi:hypothetical protein